MKNKINNNEFLTNVIYGSYIKYDRLKYLIDTKFSGSSATEIDMYIDIKNIMHWVYVQTHKKQSSHIDSETSTYVSSKIVNLCAHYRNFFKTAYGVHTRFILICGAQQPLNKKWCDEYYTSISPTEVQLYADTLSILEMLVPYLPDIELYTSWEFEFGAVALSISNKLQSPNPSFILTTDSMAMQVVTEKENMYMLYPIKYVDNNGTVSVEDSSIIIDETNVVYEYYDSCGVSSMKRKTLETMPINSKMLTCMMAFSRVPSRDLHGVHPTMTVIKDFTKNNEALKYLSPADIIYNDLWEKYFPGYNPDLIMARFRAIDYYRQSIILAGFPEFSHFQGFNFLRDEAGVKKVNEEIFAKCPLDLNVL